MQAAVLNRDRITSSAVVTPRATFPQPSSRNWLRWKRITVPTAVSAQWYDDLSYLVDAMPKTKVALTLEAELIRRVDELVDQRRFRNRSQAIEEALADRLQHLARTRLALECTKLDAKEEKELAEEGFAGSKETWPEY